MELFVLQMQLAQEIIMLTLESALSVLLNVLCDRTTLYALNVLMDSL